MHLPKARDYIGNYKLNSSDEMALSTQPINISRNTNTRVGHAQWMGKTFQVNSEGEDNFQYFGSVEFGVTCCVVDCVGKTGYAYIISDDFSACHVDVLYNEATKQFAVLHVWNENNLAEYERSDGWERVGEYFSKKIFSMYSGRNQSIISFTCVDRSNRTQSTSFVALENLTSSGPQSIKLGSAPAHMNVGSRDREEEMPTPPDSPREGSSGSEASFRVLAVHAGDIPDAEVSFSNLTASGKRKCCRCVLF